MLILFSNMQGQLSIQPWPLTIRGAGHFN